MVRFKNRYILVDYQHLPNIQPITQKLLLKFIKQHAADMMGQLFLAKISFSCQIKYLNLGKALIRVARDCAKNLQACLFIIKGLKVIKVSGTIRCIQKKLFQILRKELHRQLSNNEAELINKIDYS